MIINGKCLKDNYKKQQIVVKFKINLAEELSNNTMELIFSDKNLFILFDSLSPEFDEIKELSETTTNHVSSISSSNLPSVNNNHRFESYSNNDLEDLSKDLNSYDNSTNDLMDSNTTFEQTIEELRSYISLVGISLSQGYILNIFNLL